MLETLKNIFKQNKEPLDSYSDSDFYDPEPHANPNFLTDPEKIKKLLKDIEDDSPLCTIIVDGSSEEFSSSILDVQVQHNQIILDELLPKHGNELLNSQQKLKLSTLHNGIHLAFKLEKTKTGLSRGIAYYKASLPDRIYYPQRRSTPRIQLTTLSIGFSGISSRTQSTIGGTVFDLSRGGVGFITFNNRARFQRGDSISNCKIILDDHTVKFDLAVRFIKTSHQDSNKTQIGGYFENLSSKDQKKLEYFVASLERMEIRKRRG